MVRWPFLAGFGGGYSPATLAAIAFVIALVVTYTAPSSDEQAAGGRPVPEDVLHADYDHEYVAAYWARRPTAVAIRSLQVLLALSRVGSGLLLDNLTNRYTSD